MRNQIFIKPESIDKIYKSFVDEQELSLFVKRLDSLTDELHFLQVALSRMYEFDTSDKLGVIFRSICTFLVFCKQDMDLIHQLVSVLEFESPNK